MRVILHNLLDESAQTYEGDPDVVERAIRYEHPWLCEHVEYGDLDTLLEYIDSQQMYDVEVTDHSPHPFLKE